MAMARDIRVIWSSWPTACTTCAPWKCSLAKTPTHRQGNPRNLRPHRQSPGHAQCARGIRRPRLQSDAPDAFLAHPSRRQERPWQPQGNRRQDRTVAGQLPGRGRHRGRGQRPAKTPLWHLQEDARQAPRLQRDHGRICLPHHRRQGRYLLSRARRRTQPVQAAARSLQGLHRDSQGQRLPVAAHDAVRHARRTHRDPDPHSRNGRDGQQRIAAHWLYKSNEDEQPKGNHARARQWVKGILELQQRAGNSLEFIESVKIDLFPDEVYVFTPKGRIMELPKGSTAVDFAYAVHTDVGNSCIACRINRRLAPLSEPLQSGSTVEIVSAPGARPNPAWLNFVVTGKARTHIRHALKQQRRSESISLGERLLNKVLTGFDSSLEKIRRSASSPFSANTDWNCSRICSKTSAWAIAWPMLWLAACCPPKASNCPHRKAHWPSAAPKAWCSATPSAAPRSPATRSSGTCRRAKAWSCTGKLPQHQ